MKALVLAAAAALGLLVLVALTATPAAAQTPAVTKIGYVDMKRLLDNAPQVVAGREKLSKEFAPRDASLKTDEKRLDDLRERQQKESATMATTDAETLKREIDALDRSIKRNREAMRNDLKSRSDQELDKSWREINDAVVAFAREQGYDIIVPSPVVYASARVDITDQVLDRLRKQYREKPAGATP
ncbi:MAG TPA: OmpH family outer membrane protein [Rhodanobacteraceae bacterium]|nr:OmpH family outer membrane protein [Rhodanobacteraceae bacterium]